MHLAEADASGTGLVAMLLTGTFSRTLDDKKRLGLPKRIRQQLENPEAVFVTPGPDQSLWRYSQPALERLAEKLEPSTATDAEARGCRQSRLVPTETGA